MGVTDNTVKLFENAITTVRRFILCVKKISKIQVFNLNIIDTVKNVIHATSNTRVANNIVLQFKSNIKVTHNDPRGIPNYLIMFS